MGASEHYAGPVVTRNSIPAASNLAVEDDATLAPGYHGDEIAGEEGLGDTPLPRTSADAMRKRSVVIAGHRTSVSLETAFWSGLKEIADRRGMSVNRLVETIDQARATNLSSAIRVFVLKSYRDPNSGAEGAAS